MIMRITQEMKNKDLYGSDFHSSRHIETKYAADRILSILYQEFPELNRVIDVGCGIGTFLHAAKAHGATQIKGVDGDWVNRTELVISASDFQSVDLNQPPLLDETYDLVISLEVAEHLPKERAERFIKWLCNLAPVILFSAAIPGQGGVGHQNEAWQSYWVNLFEKQGFKPLDIIRPEIWDDQNIYFWYRQNVLVFSKNSQSDSMKNTNNPIDIVHPELYLSKFLPKSLSLSARWVRRIKRFIWVQLNSVTKLKNL
jgi:SAM-dependent methyltransferase